MSLAFSSPPLVLAQSQQGRKGEMRRRRQERPSLAIYCKFVRFLNSCQDQNVALDFKKSSSSRKKNHFNKNAIFCDILT